MPTPFWFAAGAIILVSFFMHRTLFGRYCYAIGSNAEAARLSGVPVVTVRLLTFVAAALLSGLAGMLYVGYLPTATPSLGASYELHAVAAAVLGGCSLQGGKGSVFGVVIGAGILQITFNAVNLIGQSLWQNVVAGGVILAAVIVDRADREQARARGPRAPVPAPAAAPPHDHGRRSGGGAIMSMRILVTGATGKVGQPFIARLLADPSRPDAVVRALCHNRKLPARDRGWRWSRARSNIRDGVDGGDGRRDPRPAPGDQQGDARVDHGRGGQGPVLAAGGLPRAARRSSSSS